MVEEQDLTAAVGPITEDWLRACGFKWEQFEHQPNKQWLLWLGGALKDPNGYGSDHEWLGIELARGSGGDTWWHCWVRADYCGRYTRFLHVRHMTERREVAQLVEALTGVAFVPGDVLYGCLRTPEVARRMRAESDRLDVRVAREWGGRVDRQAGADPAQR